MLIHTTLLFRHLTLIASGQPADKLQSLFNDTQAAIDWLALWETATHNQPNLAAMQSANPIRIPRNHRVEEAIQAGYQGDFIPFQKLQTALAHPFEESPQHAPYEERPHPNQVVHETFCGT